MVTRSPVALSWGLAAALLAGLVALATPVFAGGSDRRVSMASATDTLTISPSLSRIPAAPTNGPLFASPLRRGSGKTTRSGSTATLTVVLAVPGKAAPARKLPRAAGGRSASTRRTFTAAQLWAIAAAARHPIFWAGPRSGAYELTAYPGGGTVLRYLPSDVATGGTGQYLTVSSFIRPSSPYAVTRSMALAKHASVRVLAGNGLAIQYSSSPRTAYLVFPGERYELQVYDPVPGEALRLAIAGKVVRIAPEAAQPKQRRGVAPSTDGTIRVPAGRVARASAPRRG